MRHFRPFFILLAVAAAVTLTAGYLPAAEKIDINSASVKELTKLHRIGPALAERIVEYREKHGPFENPEDITKVKGIGAKTFEGFRDRIIAGKSGKNTESGKPEGKKDSETDKTPKKKGLDADKAPEKKSPETDSSKKNESGKKSSGK